MEDNHVIFGVQQYYSKFMKPYFSPFMVVAAVLAKIDINPYMIKRLDANFFQEDMNDVNVVRLTVELNFPMSDGWIEHMKKHLSHLMKDAFLTAYGQNSEPWFSNYDKEAPPFLKGTPYEGK
jgi:hypothetical protein